VQPARGSFAIVQIEEALLDARCDVTYSMGWRGHADGREDRAGKTMASDAARPRERATKAASDVSVHPEVHRNSGRFP
jgi:hypothetical protein